MIVSNYHYLLIHPSGKYVTLAIEPRFRVSDISQSLMSQSWKRGSIAKVTYFPPEACIGVKIVNCIPFLHLQLTIEIKQVSLENVMFFCIVIRLLVIKFRLKLIKLNTL